MWFEVFTYLFVEFDEGGLEKLIQLRALVVGVLHVTETLAQVGFLWQEDLLDLTWKGVEWHLDVLSVSDLL